MKADEIRSLFPIMSQRVYLKCAAGAPLNTRAAEAMKEVMSQYLNKGPFPHEEWQAIQDGAKSRLSELLGVKTRELAFIPNTTRGIYIAMLTIPWQEGDNVIVQRKAFPAILYPWEFCPVPGIEVRWAEGDLRGLPETIKGLVDRRTRAIFVDWVHFSTGEVLDLAAVSQIARERGIFLVVDGTQGLGPLFPDIPNLGVDFWANSCAKWLLGIEGSAFLYINEETIGKLKPNLLGWFSGATGGASRLFPMAPPSPGASRFEDGARSLISIAALSASLGIFLQMDRNEITGHIRELTGLVHEKAKMAGHEVISPKEPRAGIVSFRPEGDPEEYFKRLKANGVIVAFREGLIRVSPHIFNNHQDIERVFM
ncbi:MAG: aminotransferase class V-fold PLP-dependent enzyme [candidate division WOR-3 bacterium]